MTWEMDVDEIEAVLEKIWDLHDKLSDAIHSISRAHFLNCVKHPNRKSGEFYLHRNKKSADDDQDNKTGQGFVFVKEYRVDEDEPAVQEAKSLYAIRTALENLEEQLEFFHVSTVQTQQRAEKEAAVARLERSRVVLAMRLAEHQGKKFKVIEEAQALIGDVQDASRFVAAEHLYGQKQNALGDDSCEQQRGKRANALVNFFLSSFNLVSKSLKLEHTVGIIGNAALVAISMFAFVHLNQVGRRERYAYDIPQSHDCSNFRKDARKASHGQGSIDLDVMLARG